MIINIFKTSTVTICAQRIMKMLNMLFKIILRGDSKVCIAFNIVISHTCRPQWRPCHPIRHHRLCPTVLHGKPQRDPQSQILHQTDGHLQK